MNGKNEPVQTVYREVLRGSHDSAELTWDDIFAWGAEVARRGKITKERSRELLREVRVVMAEGKAERMIARSPELLDPLREMC